jgi:hypothetical protein
MSSADVPAWITVTEGRAPILLFAPHGGRRQDARIPGTHKVNDLWTAEVTRELAARCGAATIVNATMDRNVVDLNRLSQVQRDAPWLLGLLVEVLGPMLARHGHATVLVVHGWNVSQPACDVGIGAREDDGGNVGACRPGSLTASDAFLVERVRALQARAETEGITVTIGSRYPAAHPNNLLQLFRSAPEPLGTDPLAPLRDRGTIDAAQIELAIPLRWPGPRRDRFVTLMSETIAGTASVSTESRSPARLRAIGGRMMHRRGLQFVADDMLVMVSIEASEAGPMGGRLVVSRDKSRLALFTGELAAPGEPWRVPPLAIAMGSSREMRVTFDGPMVGFPFHGPFVDLERGLAGGTLLEGRLDVTFRSDPGHEAANGDETFGEVRGELVIDGRRTPVLTRGAAVTALASAVRRLPSCRVTLPTSPWGTVALVTEPEDPLRADGARWIGTLHGAAASLDARSRLRVAGDLSFVEAERSMALRASYGRALHGTLERLLPVRRPGREGTVVETTFALLRIAGTCVGWVEVSMVLSASSK